MRWKMLFMVSSLVFIAACGNDSEQGANEENLDNIQPINYETKEEQKTRLGQNEQSIGELGGYPQSEQERVNEGDKNFGAKNEDRYTNERTYYIAEKLSERKEVVQAQVAETDKRVIVAVMTGNKYYPDLPKSIREEVKEMIPDKEIVVYTDAAWWDRMRNLNSNPDKLEITIERNLNNFFNNN
ncbi:YhcN/YlaJ family sporulation lipoprotein [Ornithinibacillus halotolerans]|uniref:Sporulation lipoprotein YhcN/YlaJ n=1 Tax=Ornithinibacillus halotolerans TaxID=1274357 RepID=A0A916RW88_9BACI|nr:YhcN/YlaJ family sporulation lipoprotein [Ornithinibacillus halotolerans]GGA69285.1 hypothetical protein GCM10008025_11600 [Ornithinibacillus halotolerans]